MLQRFLGVTALLASVVAVGDAVNIHIKMHHPHRREASNTTAAEASSWHMKPVVSIQARVQGDKPSWDETTKTWVSKFGTKYDEKFRNVMDTVNTASVEGALMYVQAEGINVKEQSVKCERKYKMQYVVFYEITVLQPTPAVAFYDSKHSTLEYCPFVAMDSNQCTPSGTDFPDTCKQFDGIGGQPKVGHCVGSNKQDTDPRAPYPDNYWFSYPNSCVTKKRGDEKTDACRAEAPGGLCAPGVAPDGETCTFTYKILGYLNIDDLVGITDGTWKSGGASYSNFTEFCNAGNVEFSATNTGSGFEVESSIPFWEKPGDSEANAARAKKMLTMYNKLAPDSKDGVMTPLTEPSDLVKKNPPCYENTAKCATASNGCRRVLYSQLCQVCDKASDDCVKAPSDFKFPTLPVPVAAKNSSGSGSASDGVNGTDGKNSKTPQPSTAVASAAISAAAIAFSALVTAML